MLLRPVPTWSVQSGPIPGVGAPLRVVNVQGGFQGKPYRICGNIVNPAARAAGDPIRISVSSCYRVNRRGESPLREFKHLEPLDESVLREVEAQASTASRASPVARYERGWAAVFLRQTFSRLDEECGTGKNSLYDSLKPYVAIDQENVVPYAELSARLRRSTSTLRSDLARLAARYRAILREEVGGTVAIPADVDDDRLRCSWMM